MGLRLSRNATAMAIAKNINNYSKIIGKESMRISSGKRIITAGDDPAGAAISTKMRAQVAGLRQAKRNANDALSLVQTSEGALNEIENILIRMRELALQNGNKSTSNQDARLINIEYHELKKEINRISHQTSYNGIPLLNGRTKNLDFQIGPNSGRANVITLKNGRIHTTTKALGIGNNQIYRTEDSRDTFREINGAISKISKQRAYLGAIQERLGFASSHLDSMAFHKEQAYAAIEDVDYSESISTLVKAKILQNYSQAALAQANLNSALVLKLL